MSLQESVSGEELAQRLKDEFAFVSDETGNWLQSDDFTSTDIIPVGREELPTRARLAGGGALVAFGIRKVDIEGAIRLAVVDGDSPATIDHLRTFWGPDTRIKTDEDDTWLFMGAHIEPTVLGFEKEINNIHGALEVAFSGMLKGLTRDDMASDKWYSYFIERAENPAKDGGRSVVFKEKDDIDEEGYEDEEESDDEVCHDRWDRSAENLASFRIETYEKSVHNGFTTLKVGDRIGRGKGGWLIAHNGEDTVTFHDSFNELDPETGENIWVLYSIDMQIPEGIVIKTVADVAKLSSATLKIHPFAGEETASQYEVKTTVEDHRVVLESVDGNLHFEFGEPQCDDCELPIWKFRWPSKEEWKALEDPTHTDIIKRAGWGSGNGVYSFNVPNEEQAIHCLDCHHNEEERFAEQFPLARRANAVAAVREALDKEGYSDVMVLAEQVWPAWDSQKDQDLELYTYVEYERDGMKIHRRTGRPTLRYDGALQLNQKSREYIELR
jgi:hypothetical protein